MWFQTFVFLPLPGETIQFDEHIFQRGWFNHQLETALGPRLTMKPWRLRNPMKSLEIWVKYQVIRLKMRVSPWLPMELGHDPTLSTDPPGCNERGHQIGWTWKALWHEGATYVFSTQKRRAPVVLLGVFFVRDEQLPSYKKGLFLDHDIRIPMKQPLFQWNVGIYFFSGSPRRGWRLVFTVIWLGELLTKQNNPSQKQEWFSMAGVGRWIHISRSICLYF